MSSWIVAASVGAMEALKDQGFCRWNHVFRHVQKQAKANLRPLAHPNKLSPAMRQQQHHKSEESLRTVMYLSCWGPN